MTMTKGRIDRAGKVVFSDASLSVWEEGISATRAAGGYDGERAWERQFKRDVFARIVQQLNRLGWTCVMPEEKVTHYGPWFALRHRFCQKGDLKGDLSISGRCIEFEMFQSVNCPTRPDHEGRYESDKERVMPYLLRIEMERTRRRIRDYLCNVFTGYSFDEKRTSIWRKPLEMTALQRIQEKYAESWHFKGDWADYLSKNKYMDNNRRSADGVLLEHGQRVYFFDYYGRIATGTAMYNINNMWWVVTGKYDFNNVACFHIYARCPENPRIKRNADRRRKKLESMLANAVKAMQFERAALLRDLIFPKGKPLFVVYHEEHGAYHRAGFRGYAKDLSDAGKFTADELKSWNVAPNRIVPLAAA